MNLLTLFSLLSFVSVFYVVASQKEETTLLAEDLDAATAISNLTNDTSGELQHGFKSKVGKIKTKVTKVLDKIKGGGGGSSGGSGYRYRPTGYRNNRIGSKSGSYSDLSVLDILFIVLGLTVGILLITGVMYFVCNKLRTSETSQT